MIIKELKRYCVIIGAVMMCITAVYGYYPEMLIDSPTAGNDIVALWHMDITEVVPANSYWIVRDDNSSDRTFPESAMHLRVVATSNALTTGSGGYFGEALKLSGSGNFWGYGYGGYWTNRETFRFDGLVKIDAVSTWPDGATTGVLYMIENCIMLKVVCDKAKGTADLEFTVWAPDSSSVTQIFEDVPTAKWIRLITEYNNGKMSITVNDRNTERYEIVAGPSQIAPNNNPIKLIFIGKNALANDLYFRGLLDEVRISAPNKVKGIAPPALQATSQAEMVDKIYPELLSDTKNTIALWRFDSEYSLPNAYRITPDDSSTGRLDNPMRIVSGLLIDHQGTEPNSLDLGQDFGSALYTTADNGGYGFGERWWGYENIEVDLSLNITPRAQALSGNGFAFHIDGIGYLQITWNTGIGSLQKAKIRWYAFDADSEGAMIDMDIPDGQWVRVKASYIGNEMALQIGNQRVAVDRGKKLNYAANAPIWIGRRADSAGGGIHYDGMIDELRISVPGEGLVSDISGPDGVPDGYVDEWDLQILAGKWLKSSL